jgi:HEPN domain-containing protein
MKGWLEHQAQAIPRTHRMADLLMLLPADLLDELNDPLRLLDRFYIPTRYPDALPGTLPGAMPSHKDAKEALDLARKTLQRIKSTL